jgi:hypothetical protein
MGKPLVGLEKIQAESRKPSGRVDPTGTSELQEVIVA